ncbi:ABC transporter CDR4 [Fusarium keratoplasticum]|nr:ABC transporter CDR4 [Fusarium keratoplasticum]
MDGRNSNDSRGDSLGAVEETDLEDLRRLATDLDARTTPALAPNSFYDQRDPRLDPTKPQFDPYRWAQMVLSSMDESIIDVQRQAVAFSNIRVSGAGNSVQYQETVVSSLRVPFVKAARAFFGRRPTARRRILHGFNGLLLSGELLLVLGRPGSGCSTFLKTISGHLGGLTLEPESNIRYRGLSFEDMIQHHRGEVCYNQEVDKHFPHLTVGETLSFAAAARAPRHRPHGLSRSEFIDVVVNVILAVFGLKNTRHTKVGDNFVRGVSGGERKRVSIAEMFLARARIGAWDNSTRGLDAASALQFVKALRLSADMGKTCHAVAAYQSSQSMYDLFDKVVILYEGHEIYYGPRDRAVDYFEEMGWKRDPQQVVSDFLTAITNPGERQPFPGMEEKVPRTATEFADYWKRSRDFQELRSQIERFELENPTDGEGAKQYHTHHVRQQAKHTRPTSPYLLSIPMQIRLCLRRAYQRLRNDVPTALSTVVVQIVLSLIIGSIFFNSPNTSSAFFQRGAVIFFAVLMNALITINEIMQLYSQRPIVEKQAGYAFVHPFTEALASVLIDLPIKLIRCSVFSLVLYFMTNLRRDPAQFFIFYLFLVTAILTMSAIFRSLAAVTKTVGQAMMLAGIIVIVIVVYTGFTLPQTYMRPWFSWIKWINPIFYAFEALVSNEFHGREFECAAFIPPYGSGDSFICEAVGSVPGQRFISGDNFIEHNYGYTHAHLWRNYGILTAFMVAFHCFYLVATEYVRTGQSKAEALVFRPGRAPPQFLQSDGEALPKTGTISSVSQDDRTMPLPKHTDTLTWRGVNYDIPVKEGTKRLLDNVNGWVKPGTLTALMGVSGAGKTTLLDVLAQRVPIGVVEGHVLINGKLLTHGLPRRTGYVQQQDLHLETTTVREALRFSAVLRQPQSASREEKYDYVEQVIQLLGMEDFAEAVVGSQGEGLNVEQRKLLSIGVELSAKPTLLIFLDEPTSGLDSQSSWTICALLRRLADNGQAVLATIHQPSALLFQTFDRLLFLARGGKTVYFGDIGAQSKTLLNYFARNGARRCGAQENPAEYILDVVAGEDDILVNWVEQWNNSPELREVLAELTRLESSAESTDDETSTMEHLDAEFALPLHSQLRYVALRAFQQYYRQPEYIFAKLLLGLLSGLFIGFSFWKTDHTQQGFQNALFSVFLLCTIFSTLVNQVMPKFVSQRSLYEVRERPSRVYSWKVFILSQVLVEIPWQLFVGVCAWASFYFAVFGSSSDAETRGLILLFVVQFYIYAASMAQMVIAAISDATLAAMLATLMFGMSFVFNGVMQPPDALPGFWTFMYRVSPFTYFK